jgi:hypothetical protein
LEDFGDCTPFPVPFPTFYLAQSGTFHLAATGYGPISRPRGQPVTLHT